MSDGLVNAQEILIKSCMITGSSGQALNFKDMIIEFNYFEDIFANGISGGLLINHSMGYINILQLQGSEVLVLEIDKPGLDLPIKQNFRIYTIADRIATKSTNENYVIKFYTEELFLNEQYRISKSYTKMKISDIVNDLASNQLKIPSNKLKIDKTAGLRDIVIPNFKPIQAINWLSTFAIADGAKNIGSPFLFYEDRDGFKFKSILTLFQQPVYKTYEYSAKGLKDAKNPMVSDIAKEIVNVIQYEHVKNFDSITAVRSGAFANKMHTIDPLRLKLGETNFNYSEYIQKETVKLNDNTIPVSAKNRFGDTVNDTAGVIKFCMTTTGQSENEYIKNKNVSINENRIEETVPYRTAQIALFCSNRLKLLIPGDVYMTIGRIIKFNLPEISYNDPSRKKKDDEFFSGKYLVTAVRHLYNQEGKFVSCIEICKESYPDKHGSYNNSNPEWKSLR
jgi:hypothetical protein